MIDQRFTDEARWQELAGYSRAVRSGSHIAVSGTTASGPDGSPIVADTYRQTLDALRRGMDAIVTLGGRVADVVRTRLYLVPGADWQAAARAHREVFDSVRPANTMLFVTALVGEGLLVEIELDAEVGAAPNMAGVLATAGAGGGSDEVDR